MGINEGAAAKWRSLLWCDRILEENRQRNVGFTLIEVLAVVAILGILITIGVPSWLGFLSARTLTSSQDQLYSAIRHAQTEAMTRYLKKEVSIRETNGRVQWNIHTVGFAPVPAQWESLPPNIRIDRGETTFIEANGAYQIQFDHRGNLEGQLGRLTLNHRGNNRLKRCVVMSTLIGAMRKGSERTTPDATGRYCY